MNFPDIIMLMEQFIKEAIQNSQKSFEEGNFPAGALVMKDGKVLASEVSSPYPDHRHADSKAIDKAFEMTKSSLDGAILVSSMHPCLMCLSRAYWAGIRTVYFAIRQNKVSSDYYETPSNIDTIANQFNAKIELIHLESYENEALEIVHKWEVNVLKK
jgi:tRNA(Arg) A34 adenosine deaminase TadA